MDGAERDVFISTPMADWVRTLAENLYQAGLELFFDEWDIAPGDVLVHCQPEGDSGPRRHDPGSFLAA